MSATVLPEGLPAPAPAPDGLGAEYWEGTRAHELRVQYCPACQKHQWGPEHICYRCHSTELEWRTVEPRGTIYSWERCWYPVHPALKDGVPYVVVLVELPHADGIRMVGNLSGDPEAEVVIGGEVRAVFEDHDDADAPYTLVQWERA